MRPWIHHPAPTTTVPKIVSTTTLRPLTTSTKANVELNRTGSQLITNNLNSLNNYGYPKHIKNNDGKEYYPNSVIPNRNLHAKPIPRFDKIEPTPVFNEIKPIPIFNAIKPIENSNEMKAIHVEEEIKPIEIDFESGELFEGTIEPTSTTTAKDEVIKDKNKPSLFDSEDSLEFEETTTEIMPTTLPPIITTQKADINEKIIRSKRDAPVIVTALLDIGRGEWHSFYRPFNTYLSYLLDLLAIDNNMIIYGDKSVVDFVHKHYHHRLADKLVIEISLESLPFYRYKQEMSDIIAKEQQSWDPKWDKKMKNHPESVYADYNILVNSKPYLLSNATEISPFPSNEFIWIDGGYSHGDHNLIPKDTWFPFLIPGKVHVVKLTPTQDKINKYTLDTIYRKDLAVISGGVIAGDREAISRFYRFFYKNFVDMLDAHKADDDQTTMLMTIKHYASLFYIIHGGWFDAFRLLPNIDDPITMKDLKKAYHPQLAESTYPYFRIHNNRTRAKL
uniref:Protein-tyrosine phosphatase n=1 Tax=Rhabditophanes sp. KR3021 TaxID=114890 RepID=A0AC35UB64_9BILA